MYAIYICMQSYKYISHRDRPKVVVTKSQQPPYNIHKRWEAVPGMVLARLASSCALSNCRNSPWKLGVRWQRFTVEIRGRAAGIFTANYRECAVINEGEVETSCRSGGARSARCRNGCEVTPKP